METLIKADIFFFIASIATVVVGTMTCVVLFYFIKAGKNLFEVSRDFKDLELKERLEDNRIFRFFFPPLRKKEKGDTIQELHAKENK